MRPEEKRANRLQDGKSRARILLKKNAGWLPGFPLQGDSGSLRWHAWPWETPGRGQVVSVDRDALRRTEMTLTKLRYHFPRALPQIVEDVDDWLARMNFLLEAVKNAVHRQIPIGVDTLLTTAPLNDRWVEHLHRLRSSHAQLRGLLDAVAFLEFTGRSSFDSSALKWIDEHAAALVAIGEEGAARLELQLTLCTLREDIDANLLTILFDCLADPVACSAATRNSLAYVEQLSTQLTKAISLHRFKIPEKPSSVTLGEAWRGFLRALLALRPKFRRQATELLGLLLPVGLAATARGLAEQADGEASRLLRLLRQLQHDRQPQYRLRSEKKQLKEQAEIVVADGSARRQLKQAGFALSRTLTIIDESTLLRQWMRLLEYVPRERSLRLGLFARWEQSRKRRRDSQRESRRFQQVASELCRLFARRGVHRGLVDHWHNYVASEKRYADELVNNLLTSECRGLEGFRRWVRLLEATVYDRNLPVGEVLLNSLEEFTLATSDVDRSARVLATLSGREDECRWIDKAEILAAFAMADNESDIAQLLIRIADDWEIAEPVGLLGRNVQGERLRRIINRCVLDGRKKSILRLASCTQMVVNLGFSVPRRREAASPPNWMNHYPSELHEILNALDQVAPDARAVAARILRKEFPDSNDLRREREAIGRKLESPLACRNPLVRERLQKRFDNLTGRISRPLIVTPQRLANLAKKIERRVDHEMVERYVEDCHATTAEAMRTAYGTDRFSETLFAPPNDQLLSGVLRMKGAMRELGLRLLLRSQDDPQCDFRNEPRNAEFLESLRGKGIRLESWLSDSLEHSAKTGDGQTYRLFFTRDILDVLLMGFHFETCLSPDSANFFSTVANALDINKQVVYGKTDSGRVVGRCLFVLADNGMILTYHRYAHNEADQFSKAVDQFAERLAKEMGTGLASSGRVSTLVAKSWYDDGAVSNESVYDLQNPEGSVRTTLRTADASQIPSKLIEFFGSKDAIKGLLGSVLLLDEFQQRREIVEPMLDWFGFDSTVPLIERFRLAMLARLAGRSETAQQIVSSLRMSSLPRRLKRFTCSHCDEFHGIGSHREVLELLIDCNPSIALRTIRITRPKQIKSDAEETSPERKEMLQKCQQLLGRDPAARG